MVTAQITPSKSISERFLAMQNVLVCILLLGPFIIAISMLLFTANFGLEDQKEINHSKRKSLSKKEIRVQIAGIIAQAEDKYNAVLYRASEYETDFTKQFDYPQMNDVRYPKISAYIREMKQAQFDLLMIDRRDPDTSYAETYRETVERYEKAFNEAERWVLAGAKTDKQIAEEIRLAEVAKQEAIEEKERIATAEKEAIEKYERRAYVRAKTALNELSKRFVKIEEGTSFTKITIGTAAISYETYRKTEPVAPDNRIASNNLNTNSITSGNVDTAALFDRALAQNKEIAQANRESSISQPAIDTLKSTISQSQAQRNKPAIDYFKAEIERLSLERLNLEQSKQEKLSRLQKRSMGN